MPKITPCLWFDNQALEAAEFYVSVFKNSKLGNVVYWDEGMPGPKGGVMWVEFTLDGQRFAGLNGGPQYQFTEAVSFMVWCKDQKELDHYWKKLSAGGREVQCGWLKDKFGLSWQICPASVQTMMAHKDRKKAGRMLHALWGMTKLDVKALEKAFAGK